MANASAAVDKTIDEMDDFPELTVEVSPIVDRSRATFAKTHNRPMLAEFTKIFSDSEK
ncbi:hypothetical protein SAMN04489751_0971 [Brevibacterium sandarakinum]|uniref:Uncharacterized protein n=1 Tax=Brevibacterium sandarakinum TaxID=629680 RepID=A0A1H1NJJ1_BRESA|nr:hypothetical protein [Brevibacterium sandarakinum]SDR99152.1 hypothetical protein SAMN04489751_0971 [Brevibacterium sandarakinum]